MILCMIVAMASNRVIGKDNKLPRYFPEDLKRFKQLTLNGTVIMGRQTYESIGKALPHRRNIVISRSQTFDDVEIYPDPEIAYATLDEELDEHDEVFVIGGASLYTYFMDRAERLYVTEIRESYAGDTYFPDFSTHFEEVERSPHDEYDFVTYRKKWIE